MPGPGRWRVSVKATFASLAMCFVWSQAREHQRDVGDDAHSRGPSLCSTWFPWCPLAGHVVHAVLDGYLMRYDEMR